MTENTPDAVVKPEAENIDQRLLRIHYIKSNQYRVCHADGVQGGPTPQGDLFFAFFSERFPIPLAIVHELSSAGLGEEQSRTVRDGFVREVEVGIHCDLKIARSLHRWLGTQIELIEDLKKGVAE